MERIKRLLDSNMNVLGLFRDISRAFDTVDHGILLKKLDNYGMRSLALLLLELSSKMQTICASRSYEIHIYRDSTGCTSRFNIRPITFHHIHKWFTTLGWNEDWSITMYADNTTLTFYTNNDARANSLAILIEWCHYNRLSLNIGKNCIASIR